MIGSHIDICLDSLIAGLTDMSRLFLCASVIVALWSASVLSMAGESQWTDDFY